MEQQQEPAQPVSSEPVASRVAVAVADESVVRRLWDVFRREPMLLVTSSYLFVSIIGLLDSYQFYSKFQLPILEYMQGGDYFVAGLRHPFYLVLLLWTLLVGMLALWPERWRQRNPHRIADVERRWWGRIFLPRRSDWWVYFGLHPETMAVVSGLVVMLGALWSYSTGRADAILAGAGNAVVVHVNDQRGTLAGEWRLLGTSTAFVFLWDTKDGRAAVVPLESIATMQPAGRIRLRDLRPGDAADAAASASGVAPATGTP